MQHVMLKISVSVPGGNWPINCTAYFYNRGGVREKIDQEVAFVSFGDKLIDTAMTLEDILSEENKLLTNGHLTLFFDLRAMYVSVPKATTQTSSQICGSLGTTTNSYSPRASSSYSTSDSSYSPRASSSYSRRPSSLHLPNDSSSYSPTAYLSYSEVGPTRLPQSVTTVTSVSRTSDKLLTTLERLVGNADYSDFILVVDGKEIPVYKAILAVRSPVFEAMFRHAKAKEVITDMKYEIACHLLRFIYAGKTPEKLSESDMELILVADKYNIPELVHICEASLVKSLTVHSAPDLLMLADRHQFPNLKKNAIDYIKQNLGSVKATEAWVRLSRAMPNLIIQYCV